MRIVAAIVIYKADFLKLERLLDSLDGKFDIIAFNNGAEQSILDLLKSRGAHILSSRGNVGLPHAKNYLTKYLLNEVEKYSHVMFLDQDSYVVSGIPELCSHAYGGREVYVPSRYVDFSRLVEHPDILARRFNIDMSNYMVSSGSVIPLEVFRNGQKFLDDLFIDLDDYVFGWDLVLKGYKIIRFEAFVLGHELGVENSKGKKQSAIVREYYQVRNALFCSFKKRVNFPPWYKVYLLFRVITKPIEIIFFNDFKASRIRHYGKGMFDWFTGRMGKL